MRYAQCDVKGLQIANLCTRIELQDEVLPSLLNSGLAFNKHTSIIVFTGKLKLRAATAYRKRVGTASHSHSCPTDATARPRGAAGRGLPIKHHY